MSVLRERHVGNLRVLVFATRAEAGAAAGAAAAACLEAAIKARGAARAIFAAAPSQDEALEVLTSTSDIRWARVTALQMDEYVGLEPDSPQRFTRYLADHLVDRVTLGRFEPIRDGDGAETECARYTHLIAEGPIDLACLGVGENGHLAFNEPDVSDFDDPRAIAVVELSAASRQQQVADGCFAQLEHVPLTAFTLTIPTLMRSGELHCVVPGPRKRAALQRMLFEPISIGCPASGLRSHPAATLYLDIASQPWSDL